MAEKKSNGFRTFLLIFSAIILALVFGFAAFLMLVPNSSLFGLRYLSNDKSVVIEKVENDPRNIFKFSDYSKIIVNAGGGNGHTNVVVNCDKPDGMSNSQIVLNQCTRGFTRVGSPDSYSITAVKNGTTLTINVVEPEYNFLQITNQTVLSLNVYDATDSILGAQLEIKTGSGNVTVGSKSRVTGHAEELRFASLDAKTVTGNIVVSEQTSISSSASMVSTKGAVSINGDKTIPSVNLESQSGRISTGKIVGNVNLKSYNSHIILGDITGNVNVDVTSGILNFANISGNLISENHMLYTSVHALTVGGDVTLVNDDGNFSVNLQKTLGNVDIRAGNKAVSIGEVCGICTIETTSGSINVKKATSNSAEFVLKTLSGGVLATFDRVKGDKNEIITTNGSITVRFGTEAVFELSATSTNGKVYRAWLDSDKNPVENEPTGSTAVEGKMNLSSGNGFIRVERV